MKNILGFVFIILLLTNPLMAQQLSKSPFIPDYVYNEFNNLTKNHKIKFCGFTNFKISKFIIYNDLPPRIHGYNSRMDNDKDVEGIYARDLFRMYTQAVTFSMVSNDDKIKEFLFDKLYVWATNEALTKTKQCYRNTQGNSILKDCEGEWSDPNGQDIAPIKDATVTLEIIMGLNYIYNLNFSDFNKDDPRHEIINNWFKFFYNRIKPADKFYWGNSAGWYFPNISLRHNNNKEYKSLVKKLIDGSDKWILDDGSIRDRTSRGDRALWYHHTGLGEAFMILEIAKAADVLIPKNFEEKLLKAVELFHDSFLDNSKIEPWALKQHNSQASNGIQRFTNNLNNISFNGPWFHIMQYRYPQHRTSKFLKSNMSYRAISLKGDEVVGIGIGCIYNALANR